MKKIAALHILFEEKLNQCKTTEDLILAANELHGILTELKERIWKLL